MRTIGVVTVGRSDYGIYRPVLKAIRQNPELRLHLIVTGAHLAPEFGLTVSEIENEGVPIGDRVEMLLPGDTPESIAKSIGAGITGLAEAFTRTRPDILVLLGDRVEMLAAACAALPLGIPVAHIHGGESSEGAIDESARHAITKMSHLHFVATSRYAERVVQMGEAPDRVFVSGAPALDNLRELRPLRTEELQAVVRIDVSKPFLLVTFHPVTLEADHNAFYLEELLAALDDTRLPAVVTYPNADAGGRVMIDRLTHFAAGRPGVYLAEHLGTAAYFGLMSRAAAMVGNSSSGIIEAASFQLPVVNIGSRQAGRVRARNVIDVGYRRADIGAGIARAVTDDFRRGLSGLLNPYDNGGAADRIVTVLRGVGLSGLLTKRFHDLPGRAAATVTAGG